MMIGLDIGLIFYAILIEMRERLISKDEDGLID